MSITEGKKRTTITIDPDLHEKALLRAKKVHHTDFAGLITKLLVDDIHNGPRLQEETPEKTTKSPHPGQVLKAADREVAENNRKAKGARRPDRAP